MATRTRRLADLLANIDDNSKVTSAGLLDATITAADLADDSVGAAELIDDSVTAAAIADDAVGSAAIADAAVDTARLAASAVTSAKIAAEAIEVKPHIKPGVLEPAYRGLLRENTTGRTFIDSSATGHALQPTAGSSVSHTSTKKKIGNTSIRFDGYNGDFLTIADHSDFAVAAGDFTWEFWINIDELQTNYTTVLGSINSAFRITLGPNASTAPKMSVYGPWGDHTTTTTTLSLNTWYHFAYVRQGTNLRLYVNGVQEATRGSSGTSLDPDLIRIGQYTNTTLFFKGHLDEIRFSNNCRYPDGTGFTPSTSAYSPDGNTKLLIHSNESAVHSGAYGTAQSDGLSYYYTDIKGSKSIKDPRIGAHFGSQRHMFKSMQLLEQETATHGHKVYSIDGREWIRGVGDLTYENGTSGVLFKFQQATTSFFEITGYFNACNFLNISSDSSRTINVQIDGNVAHTAFNPNGSANSPLTTRYVCAASVFNIDITSASSLSSDTTLGIHTLRLQWVSSVNYIGGVELIAQDTGSTARKSQIVVPAQNVVSYGKKFSIGSDTLTNAVHKHYNPFAFKTDGTTAWASGAHNGTSLPVGTGSSHNIDTATSLGLENWKHSSNYYKPYNGGRVVRWVANDGTIKTSVTVMPPNAQNVSGSAISAKANAAVANDTPLPTFSGAIEYSLSEVAKTFYWREFGNGSANGGTGAGSWADASMLAAANDAIAYVMDDGLTSLNSDAIEINSSHLSAHLTATDDYAYITFIGTGITVSGDEYFGLRTIAQNLPYGTHILKIVRDSNGKSVYSLDGVSILTSSETSYGEILEVTFHQPKRPPIPEHACVLADYMLMADFVPIASAGIQNISKGVRSISCSRDMFWNETDNATVALNLSVGASASGFDVTWSNDADSAGTETVKLSTFSTNTVMRGYGGTDRFTLIGPATEAGTGSGTAAAGQYVKYTNNYTLGTNVVGASVKNDKWLSVFNMEVVTPIHTSSHYQSFETPYLHELVGGDRNMEQNNLIVTPDGKSWDEVTRDTSYFGNHVICTTTDTDTDYPNYAIWDEWRGTGDGSNYFNKDFAIAYDRIICLKAGQYKFSAQGRTAGTTEHCAWIAHGTSEFTGYIHYTDQLFNIQLTTTLKRGDVVQLQGEFGISLKNYNQIAVERV